MIQEWWVQREPRERVLLSVLAALVAMIVAFYGIWSPFAGARDAARSSLQSATVDARFVEQGLVSLASSTTGGPGPAENVNAFRAQLTASAQTLGLSIARLQSGTDGTLQVSIDDADPTLLYSWLLGLDAQPGGRVVAATLTTRDNATVQAVIELQGGRP
ncbi:MAG: type II secretion system protein M [Pseudomonadota bacterium]